MHGGNSFTCPAAARRLGWGDMGEGGVETDAPIIVAILGETAAPIIASEGVEAVAPIVAISVLHAL